MKSVSVRELQRNIRESVDCAQEDRVIVTRNGKPAAVLIGVEGQDWETVLRETDPTFWQLVRARREQPTISLEELDAEIGTTEA